jgi:hypothetical protein
MRTFIVIAAASLAAVSVGVWLAFVTNSTTHTASLASTPSVPPVVSVWEIHNQAHLEFLPVQSTEDQTTIFATARR